MDLPPPPPPPLFHHHHHLRYENALRHPDFFPPRHTRDLPPPPPERILLPPPPPPPPPLPRSHPPPWREMAHPPRRSFSPPVVERSRVYEFDRLRKPYSRPDILPPQRENIPLRLIRDYPERSPMFRDEILHRGCGDDYVREIRENWDGDLEWRETRRLPRVADARDCQRYREFRENWDGDLEWREMGRLPRVADARDCERYRESYDRRDDEERRWGNGIGDWDRDLYGERDYKERRYDNGIGSWDRDLYGKREYRERRLDSGIDDLRRELCSESVYEERRWDNEANDWGSVLCNGREFNKRRWNNETIDLGRELYTERDFDDKRWDNGTKHSGGEFNFEGNNDVRSSDCGSNGNVFSRLGNREPVSVKAGSNLGRFSGRLGSGVSKVEFARSKKKRKLEKNSSLHRTPFGKDFNRHSGGHKSQHVSKKSGIDGFRDKEKERSECLETSMKEKREREQSPMELAISFKSNAMVAKAILGPSHPASSTMAGSPSAKSGEDVVQTAVSTGGLEIHTNTMSGLPSAKSSEDVVQTAISTGGLELHSNPQGTSKELRDKEVVFANRSIVAVGADNELGEIAINNEPVKDMKLLGPTTSRSAKRRAYRLRKKQRALQLLHENNIQIEKDSGGNYTYDFSENAAKNETDVRYGATHVCRPKKKKRGGHQLSPETNPEMKKDSGDIININGCTNSSAVGKQRKSDTTLKGNLSSAFIGVVPDTALLLSSEDVSIEEGEIIDDYYKPFVPDSKRKRNSSTTSSASSYECSDYGERLVIVDQEADLVCQLRSDEASCHANQTFSADDCNRGDLIMHNGAPVLDTEKNPSECIDRNNALGPDKFIDISKHPFQDGVVLLDKSSPKGSSKAMVSIEGHRITGSSRPQENWIPEVQEDNFFSRTYESNTSSESDSALLQEAGNVTNSNMGSPDTTSEEFVLNLADTSQVGCDAEHHQSSEGAAVADDSNISLGTSMSSNFHAADQNGVISQLDVSLPNALSKQSLIDGANLLHLVDPVEESPEAVSNVKSCSTNNSSKVTRKRKARDALACFSGSNTNVLVDATESIDSEDARILGKDLTPAAEVNFLDEEDNCMEDNLSKGGPCRVEDSSLGVDFGANGLFPGYRKKIKAVSPVSNLSGPLEDDVVVDELTHDCTKLDKGYNRRADSEAEQRKDTSPSSVAASKCGTTDSEGKFGRNLDGSLADGNKLNLNDDLAFLANNLSFYADRNGVCPSNSGDELLVSCFDRPSCTSSPEELLSYSDLTFSRNNKGLTSQSAKEMVSVEDIISNKKHAVSSPNTFSLGKSLKKAVSDDSCSNADILPHTSEDKGKVVKELSLAHGKLTLSKNPLNSAVPKVFPSHRSLGFSNSRKFHSTHVPNSRTWHRTGNSPVAAAEPKLQSPPLPQSHGTMTSGTVQSSYVRKGNSLVRKSSPSAAASPGFHGSSTLVSRLTPVIDNLKDIQASDRKAGNAHTPKPLGIKRVSLSETPKVLNHSVKPLNCTSSKLQDSLPVGNPAENDCCKTLDALGESTKSSVDPECETAPVNISDSQSTLEEGNLGKKIIYVKRRSNQLVAASNSDDTSISGVEKTQGLSDGYYKSRKNQLVRASSENHVETRDANTNSCELVSHTIRPKISIRHLSASARAGRYSKLSFVWKLHDSSSEKLKNLVGPQKVWPRLAPWKRATYRRKFRHALATQANNSSFSTASQKLLFSRKRGAIYTRSTHGYSLKISKVLSVSGRSLKWSKSIEKNSKKASEEATRAVAAAQKREKEEKDAAPIALKSRNHVSRKSVLNVKLRPGERIFRIGSERYKMDPTRRTLHRITSESEQEPSSLVVVPSEKKVKRSYVPRRLFIGNEEYVRIGNGNQLIRDPKKRTRVLASEKVRWSLRTARLSLARKKRYCQFFTRYGKCNKDDGKCPYIHDPSKIAVCTKFLSGSCSKLDCKLTHKVIPERMQDCSYFLKGSCSNENCPYRHVNVDPDSTVCEGFLRGYCADGNECRKKHTYVCPAFEATGTCPQVSTCKLHHPKKKTERKATTEQQKVVRGRYFDGGLIGDDDAAATEKLSANGKDNTLIFHEGKFPDFISLDVGDDEEVDPTSLPDAQIRLVQ